MKFKEWDRVVANEPDKGIINAKGTVVWVTECDDGQTCTVKLDEKVKSWPLIERSFIDDELTLLTNKPA